MTNYTATIKQHTRIINPKITRHDWPMHQMRVRLEMQQAGASRNAFRSMEGKYIPHIIHIDEHIQGIVFGYQEVGFAMLIATDKRVLFLDKKPMFTNQDELTYNVVSGVVYNHSFIGTTVVLHTRVKDFKLFTRNKESVETFVHYIELRCLENKELDTYVLDQAY